MSQMTKVWFSGPCQGYCLEQPSPLGEISPAFYPSFIYLCTKCEDIQPLYSQIHYIYEALSRKIMALIISCKNASKDKHKHPYL